MDSLLAAAFLKEQIGEAPFAALVNRDNIAAVVEFAWKLIDAGLPSHMTVGDRTYDIFPIMQERETFITGDLLESRARGIPANLGQDDGEHLLDLNHQKDIPVEFRDRICFVFPEWKSTDIVPIPWPKSWPVDKPFYGTAVSWDNAKGQWRAALFCRDGTDNRGIRVLRRK